MAEYQHDSAVGSWFFQAVVASAKLDRMTKNARAAHWNKPRGVRYRESADIGTTTTNDFEQTHMTLLAGVRVIQGRTSPSPNFSGPTYQPSDLHPGLWIGDPQTLFPTGAGLPPFVGRPVVTCNLLGLQVIRDAPDPPDLDTDVDPDYSFVNWFGGLDWGDPTGSTTPQEIEYHVDQLTSDEFWPRAVVARPINETHTGQAGAYDVTIGLRFRLIFGRVGGGVDFPSLPFVYVHPGAYYIHYHAMGPVAVY